MMKTAPEVFLVIECTRLHPNGETIARIRKYIEDGVSWMTLIQFAMVHGVFPLVANTLKLYAADLLPRDVLFQCDRVLVRAESRNQRQWSSLTSVMQAFADHGVRILAFKGPSLAFLAYGDLRLRESHDLDLWAAPDDTATAGEILRSIGYLPATYKGGKPFASLEQQAAQVEYISADGEIAIDLQGVRPQFYFTPKFDEFWDRRRIAMTSDQSVFTLGREDLLLALAVHGAKHSWRRMNWIVDVDRLLSSLPEVDWSALSARAVRWRCQRRLFSAVALLSNLYGGPVPSHAARYQSDWTTRRVMSALVDADVTHTPVRTLRLDAESLWYTCRLTDRRRDRANLVYVELQRRIMRLLSTIRKRVRLTSSILPLGRWNIRVYYPRLLFRVDLGHED